MLKRHFRVILLLSLLVVFGCSSILRLQVTYRLPEETSNFKGPVSVEVIDRRPLPGIFTERASEGTGALSKDIQLSLAQPRMARGFLLGVFELPEIFKTAFLERFKAAGVATAEDSNFRLQIEIQEFLVDVIKISLVEKRWHVKMQYQGTFFRGNSPVYSQNVRIDSEKLRYWKDIGLDSLATEAFTEAINTFDLREAIARAQ